MPGETKRNEKEYYPLVENFLCKRFACFETAQNKGMTFGRVDVVGIRDLGGQRADLTGIVEVIAVEVKAGNQPFSTAVGQAYSYSIYADRCYLADYRPKSRPFKIEEIDMASKLGVGLLAIHENKRISEVLASPQHSPLVHA